MDKVELIFSGLRMELNKGRKKKHRILLDGSINGVAKPGRMMAIMGPRYVESEHQSAVCLWAQNQYDSHGVSHIYRLQWSR